MKLKKDFSDFEGIIYKLCNFPFY